MRWHWPWDKHYVFSTYKECDISEAIFIFLIAFRNGSFSILKIEGRGRGAEALMALPLKKKTKKCGFPVGNEIGPVCSVIIYVF